MEFPEENGVVVLSGDNFEQFIADRVTLVEFYGLMMLVLKSSKKEKGGAVEFLFSTYLIRIQD